MTTAHQFAGALAGLSQDLGMFAQVKEKQQEDADAEALAARKDAANKAFQLALTNAQMQQQQSQFDATRADRQQEQQDTSAFRNKQLEAETSYRSASLQSEAAYRAASLGMEKSRLGIEQQNADTERSRAEATTHAAKTDRSASYVGEQVTAAGKVLLHQRDAMTKEANAINADLTLSDAEKAAKLQQVQQRYQPLIDAAQSAYARHSKRFSELTGEDPPSPEEAAMMGTKTDGTDPAASATGTEPAASAPASDPAVGPSGLIPTDTATPPASPAGGTPGARPNGSPYPDGTMLKGPDGKQYVVRLGRPVPVDSL